MNESQSQSQSKTKIEYKPFYLRGRFLIGFLVAGIIYSYAWKATEIDLGELFRDAHLIKPLVKDLLQPDLWTANTETATVEASFELSEETSLETPIEQPPGAEPALVLSRVGGSVGDGVIVEGFRLRPGALGRLVWVNGIEQEYPLGSVETGEEGRFRLAFSVPETARGREQTVRLLVSWKTGGWKMSHTLELVLDKIVETFFLALMATTLAMLVAAPLSFFGARNLTARNPLGWAVYYIVRTLFNVLRSIEPLILAILFAVWVGIGPFAGVLALGLHSIAALGKLYSEQIENIDPGPVEAMTATGATRLQVILYGVIPQVIPPFLAFTFYRWDINVRMSTIIGFVGGGGIGFLLQQWINLLKYNEAGTALLAIAIVVIALDAVSARVREKLA